jgi:hypothetical protein
MSPALKRLEETKWLLDSKCAGTISQGRVVNKQNAYVEMGLTFLWRGLVPVNAQAPGAASDSGPEGGHEIPVAMLTLRYRQPLTSSPS